MSVNTVMNDSGHVPPHTGYPVENYQITPEEMQVLDKCNWESFIKRSLPIGSFLGVSTAMAIKKGFLRPNAQFGIAPKVTTAVVIGYVLGKASYQRECAEKLMSLPNSGIGQMLRDKQGLGSTAPLLIHGDKQEDIYTDSGCILSQDIHTDQPQFSYDPPITDLNPSLHKMRDSEKISNDQHRKQKTDIYTETMRIPYGADPLTNGTKTPPPIGQREPQLHRNKYGDIID